MVECSVTGLAYTNQGVAFGFRMLGSSYVCYNSQIFHMLCKNFGCCLFYSCLWKFSFWSFIWKVLVTWLSVYWHGYELIFIETESQLRHDFGNCYCYSLTCLISLFCDPFFLMHYSKSPKEGKGLWFQLVQEMLCHVAIQLNIAFLFLFMSSTPVWPHFDYPIGYLLPPAKWASENFTHQSIWIRRNHLMWIQIQVSHDFGPLWWVFKETSLLLNEVYNLVN